MSQCESQLLRPQWDERLAEMLERVQAGSVLEDPWHRRNTACTIGLDSSVFGFPLRLVTNSPNLRRACQLGLSRFSKGPPRRSRAPIYLRLFAREADRDPAEGIPAAWDGGSVPFLYDGQGDSAAIDFGLHGHCAIDLSRREAVGFVSCVMSGHTELVARLVVGTALLSILAGHGLIQWHAATVVKGDAAFALVGGDNSGKSVTALSLLLKGGYRILGESLTYTELVDDRFTLMGFPVGQLRLRPSGIALFPDWQRHAHRVDSEEGEKWLLDLSASLPAAILRDSIITKRLVLLFVSVGQGEDTLLRRLSPAEALERSLPACSLWLERSQLTSVLDDVALLVARAPSYQLLVGTDGAQLVRAVDSLAAST